MGETEDIDFSQVRTYPLSQRANKVHIRDFAHPIHAGATFVEFLDSLPNILMGTTFRNIVEAIAHAHHNRRAVAFALGAHVVKCGLNPVIIDLMRRGIVTSVSLNGGASIHDFEIALIGETSEDVQEGILDGHFGMAEETGRLMNEALLPVIQPNTHEFSFGMGELLARKLIDLKAPYREYSILVAGLELNIPVTVHVGIGTDITHMHPLANGGAIGQASFNDFHRFTSALANLGNGGVYTNVGSAVLLPEVFLKAITILRNLKYDMFNFVTANLDMQQQYRAMENVLHRPMAPNRGGYNLIGHHELMLPLLAQGIIEKVMVGEQLNNEPAS